MAKKARFEKLFLANVNPEVPLFWMCHPYPTSLACLIFGSLEKARSAVIEDPEFPEGTPEAVEKLSRGLLAENDNNLDVLNFVSGRPIETTHKYASWDGSRIQYIADNCSSEVDSNHSFLPFLSVLLATRRLFDYAIWPCRIPRIVATCFTRVCPERASLCGVVAANWHDAIFRLRKKIIHAIEESLREIKINPEPPIHWRTQPEIDFFFKKAEKKHNQIFTIFKKHLTFLRSDEFESARANLEREFVFAEPIFYKEHPYPQQIPGWPCPEEEAECLRLLAENVASDKTTTTNSTANDDRDYWIYGQCFAMVKYPAIAARLRKKKKWEPIDTENGIKVAAQRYAKRHELPPIPRRQPGRPSK
jgi:hypothetical protein